MSASARADYGGSTKRLWAEGGVVFAGMMLSILGMFQIFQGIAAIANDDVYVTGLNYVYEFDLTAWGWIHLVVGVIALATGIGLSVGQTWALVVGLGIAALSAIANFAFLPYFPIWSLVVLAFDVFVIWALCTQLSRD